MYFYCKKGHWKNNCPKLQKGKTISNACVPKHDEDTNFSLVGMTLTCHSNEWILDSGYTYHICPNKDLFSSFKELDSGVVFMVNDSAYKPMRIGSIQWNNHDKSI